MRRRIGFAIALCAVLAAVPLQAMELAPVSASASSFVEIDSQDGGHAGVLAQPYQLGTVYDSPASVLAADFGGPIMLPDLAADSHRDEKLVAMPAEGSSDLIALGNMLFLDIPEPSTWAMLVAGLGLMGVGLRRSRHTAIQFS